MAKYVHLQHDVFMKQQQPFPERSCQKLVLCFGDCYLKGWKSQPGLLRTTEGWPYYLSLLLPNSVEVWNAAIGYYAGTYVSLLFSKFLKDIKPDLVVLQLMRPSLVCRTDEESLIYKTLIDSADTPIQMWRDLQKSNLRHIIRTRYEADFERAKRLHANRIPIDWHQNLDYDVRNLNLLLAQYSCPTLFVTNDRKHPYWRYADEAIRVVMDNAMKPKDRIVVTQYDGDHWNYYDHPNHHRAAFTAAKVYQEMAEIGWPTTWYGSKAIDVTIARDLG